MKFVRTNEVIHCREHGDSAVVVIDPYSLPPSTHLKVCYRCLNEAIDQYMEPLVCADCGVSVRKGYGIEKDGRIIPLCQKHQTKRIFGGSDAELERTDQSDEGGSR